MITHTDLYSILLVAALASVIVAGKGLGRARNRDGEQRLSALRATRQAGVAGVVLVLVAGLTHFLMGHRPGSTSPLGLSAFLGEHPALIVILLMSIAALVFSRDSRA